VPSYAAVAYEDLYAGIDLKTWGQRDSLKYEFHVAPGADYRQIQVHYAGIEGLSLSDNGSLRVNLGEGWGELVDDVPYIYQVIDGRQVAIAGQFELIDSHSYTFTLTDAYDAALELVIDPDLAWASYLGGSGDDAFGDYGYGISVDAAGNALVTGLTVSTNFAGANNAYKGGWDAFVAKVSSGGTLAWATYLGGSGTDYGWGIAVDAAGNALVTGGTFSTDFAGANNANHGDLDAFVAKVSSGGTLAWATYLGGSDYDYGWGIAVDAAGNALLTGYTYSTDFAGANNAYKGGWDAFVAKVSNLAAPAGYPGAIWVSGVPTTNYTASDRTADDIRWIVLHTTECTAWSAINCFKDPAEQVSANYLVTRDGTIYQLVRDCDIAYHAGNWPYNQYSIGIEHERYGSEPLTAAQYAASAQLVGWLSDHYGIPLAFPGGIGPSDPLLGGGIIGHNQVPHPTLASIGGGINRHSDPVSWDWPSYIALVTGSTAQRPGAPQSLRATPTLPSEVQLSWEPGPGTADSFRIERRLSTASVWDAFQPLAAGITSFMDSTVSGMTSYFYRLLGLKGSAASEYSETVSVRTPNSASQPVIESDPPTPLADGTVQTVTVLGQKFLPGVVVSLTGPNMISFCPPTTRLDDTHITFTTDFGTVPGQWSMQVVNPGDIRSAQQFFNVMTVGFTDGYDYPVGNRGYKDNRPVEMPEFSDPNKEKNSVYRQYAGGADLPPPSDQLDRTGETRPTGWYNYQDVGAFYDTGGGIHSGEDWNLPGVDDVGEPVYPIGDGQIVFIGPTGSSPYSYGWTIVILHHDARTLSDFYSVYSHVTHDRNNDGGTIADLKSQFSFQVGDWVTREQSQPIARVANISGSHLHFEIREKMREPGATTGQFLYSTANGNYYYSNEQRQSLSQMSATEVKGAFDLMLAEGIKDPSDFIDQNRPSPTLGAVENGSFALGGLAAWTVAGPGLVSVVDLAQAAWPYWARFTTGSPVSLYQAISTPAQAFNLGFDYQFETTSGSLDVLLNSVVLTTLDAPAALASGPSTFSVTVAATALLDQPSAVLEFRFDGPTGSQVLLSNIVAEPLVSFITETSWTSAGNGNWSDEYNWNGAVPSGVSSAVGFGTAIGSSPATVTLDIGPTISQMTFNNPQGGSYSIDGANALTLDKGGSTVPITVTAGNHSIDVPVVLQSNVVISTAAGANLSISGGISGAGKSLTKSGDGTVTLSGDNTYSGGTTVLEGTLILSSASAQAPVFSSVGVDIQGGKMVFDYTGTSPASTIKDLLDYSYHGDLYGVGAWDRGKFRSTTAAATGLTLGWKDNGSNQVTVMATYAGDANVDGEVDGVDVDIWKLKVGSSFNVLPGDANYDGEVDGADFDIWKLNVGSSGEGVTWGMADFNLDGQVDGADLDLWRLNVGSSGDDVTWDMADFNYDGEVDGADVDVWKLNVGSSLGLLGLSTGGTGLSIVPEPGTLALLEASGIMPPAVDLPAPNIPPMPVMEDIRPVANAQGRVNAAALTWANVQPIVGDLGRDAAGQGWFLDRTPTRDEGFRRLDDESQQRAVASRAFDRVDLLAAVADELAHVAGFRDIDRITDNFVSGSLKKGVRRQPALCEVDAVFAELALLDCQRVSWASAYRRAP
jgi:autotransporter-associated beta strand protein